MLSKSLIINLGHLNISRLHDALLIRQLAEIVLIQCIQEHQINYSYNDLPISYSYSYRELDSNVSYLDTNVFRIISENTLLTFKHNVEQFTNDIIEEFNIFLKYNPNRVINFNGVMLNSNSFLVTSEVFCV